MAFDRYVTIVEQSNPILSDDASWKLSESNGLVNGTAF
jgi:hypothetical protein